MKTKIKKNNLKKLNSLSAKIVYNKNNYLHKKYLN